MDDVDARVEDAARAALRGVSGRTRTVGIVGWPVSGSLSPGIHNAAFAALGLDWIYVPLPVAPERADDAIRALPALGFAGANVTMPHKEIAAGASASLSGDARRSGAVNTLVVENGELAGHNTDVGGFSRFLEQDAGFDPAGSTAVLFGTGGAARACALALSDSGLRSLVLVGRREDRAREVASVAKGSSVQVEVVPWGDPLELGQADLVVNATPVGANAGDPNVPAAGFRSGQVVVDLLYRPAITPFLARARDAGASWFGGLGLLLHQAALSFELWTGAPAPLEVMSAAALTELSASR